VKLTALFVVLLAAVALQSQEPKFYRVQVATATHFRKVWVSSAVRVTTSGSACATLRLSARRLRPIRYSS